MTDHYTEANRALQQTLNYSETDENTGALVSIAAAQVHATLALAEQQRIANLIALAFQEIRDTTTGELVEPPEMSQQAWAALAGSDYGLRPEVARALRIETS